LFSVGSIAVYGGGGGKEWEEQKRALTEGVDIIVATPGKLISHLKLGYVKLNSLKHLVLDEADRMLDMGFSDDLKTIISYLPKERQNLMFSATMRKTLNIWQNELCATQKKLHCQFQNRQLESLRVSIWHTMNKK
jgi:superfamily II DNA/RNA helicase